MKKFRTILASFMLISVFSGGAVTLQAPHAAASAQSEIQGGANATGQKQGSRSLSGNLKRFTNILLFLVGALAVIMLVIGGIRYVVSAGDSSATTGAKNTILYAVVGLLVAILGYAIVNFLLEQFI